MWILSYFLIHLLIYALVRLQFLVWNWSTLSYLGASDLTKAFAIGLRFDLSVIAMTTGLGLLLAVIFSFKDKIARWILILFTAINSVFLIMNFVDAELFNFTAKRFSSATLYLLGEGGVSNLLFPYIPLVLSSILIFTSYIFLIKKFIAKTKFNLSLQKKIIYSFSILVMAIILGRGGFQYKPITYVDAKIFENSYANNLVLNSTFTFLKSIGKSSIQRTHYFDSEQMLSYLNQQSDVPALETKNKFNVVIIILEGFSKEYFDLTGPEVTPFLNKLRKESIDFKNAYANGRRSIEGVAAVLSGIPALMEEPFISSEFSANQIIGLGNILSAEGYDSAFFHGAQKGSMHFDSFTKSVGIKKHFNIDNYPNKDDYDGTWGIFDEPYLQYSCEEISKFNQPFLATIFTLTSHQPFALPEKYKDRFKDDRHEILKTIQYTDFAMEQFMKCAESKNWFENTVFIFTADHTGPSLEKDIKFTDNFKVPLFFYKKDLALLKSKLKPDVTAQHIDILPTVLDILGIENKNKNYLAKSLLQGPPKLVTLYSDHHYELVGDVLDAENQLKAVQQYFSEGLYDNRLYYPAKSH